MLIMRHTCIWALLIGVLASEVGCSSRPSAPVLSDSRIYDNSQEEFRMLLPEGWVQISSSVLPPGDLNGEIFLVRYNLTTGEGGANFQVVCMDDKDALDLEAHHTEPSFRVTQWEVLEGKQPVTINGMQGERMTYRAQVDNRPTDKTVVCFRRNKRIYSLIGVYWTNDANAKQQIERAIGDIIWES